MAVHGLIALLDDIATIADDVAKMTSLATQKAAGIVTDDMAVTAEQVTGIRRDRELPIIYAVAKGSMRNKLLILVPIALVLHFFAPWLITPLLMIGGLYLCYEGVEKILHPDHGHANEIHPATTDDFAALEKNRVQGAIKTDFILSAEIIALSLATIKDAPMSVMVLSLLGISVVMTVGVYGIVALLIRMDDAGLALAQKPSRKLQKLGHALLWLDPRLIRLISHIGIIAMLLVGGGIFVHGIPALEHLIHDATEWVGHTIIHTGVIVQTFVPWVTKIILTFGLGFVLGYGAIRVYAVGARFMPGRSRDA